MTGHRQYGGAGGSSWLDGVPWHPGSPWFTRPRLKRPEPGRSQYRKSELLFGNIAMGELLLLPPAKSTYLYSAPTSRESQLITIHSRKANPAQQTGDN